jgi:hypothetical protein
MEAEMSVIPEITVDDLKGLPKHHTPTKTEKMVILGSSLGTVFEWYDFYLYGLLATVITAQALSLRWRRLRPASRFGPLAPWSSGALATWSAARTPFS